MTPERWQDVKAALHEALQLTTDRRLAYIEQVSANDPELRSELESLLASSDAAGTGFLTTPVGLAAVEPDKFDRLIGRRLGPYELVAEIGIGGMGEVYRAVRADDEFHREVAIKVVRAGKDCSFVIRKFRNERQILASLDHPNIARLIDGGSSEEGMPYFVMELIVGQPIDEYCNSRGLSIVERLKLFAQVCSAVEYAHQRLVIHRDLKPGNILVTADGVPKLLDFGIAKILDPGAPPGPELTMSIFRMLTPKYASPEQVNGEAITTTTDVYSLGVILYELLTGRSPYGTAKPTPHETARAVCELEPDKPSLAVCSARADRTNGNSARTKLIRSPQSAKDASQKKLSRQLRGDLDNIVLMALRKEPQRRYASVEQFARDIRRHLEYLPITAREDTLVYRTAKFIARHKTGVATAALVSFMLLAGLLMTLREARIAERRFNDVRKLANALIFDIHDSIRDLPGSTPARKLIVERALQYLDNLAQESRGDSSLERELSTAYERVGQVQGQYLQNSLGDTKASLESYQKALAIRRQFAAKWNNFNDQLALARAYRLVANQEWAVGEYPAALEKIDRAVAISEGLNAEHPKDVNIMKELGLQYALASQIRVPNYVGGRGDPDRVEEYCRKALATDEALLAITTNDLDVQHAYATDLNHLGASLGGKDLAAALDCYNKELAIDEKLQQRSSDPRYARGVAVAYSHLAQTYEKIGDKQRTLENYSRGLDVSLGLAQLDPKNTLFEQGLAVAYCNTAHALSQNGGNDLSLSYLQKSNEIMRALAVSAPENIQQRGRFAAVLVTNGVTLMNLGKPEAALKMLDEARSIFDSLQGDAPIYAGSALVTCTEKMAVAASRAGNSKLAAEYFNEVLKVVEPALRAEKANADIDYLAADSYAGLGDLEFKKAQLRQNPEQSKESWTEAKSWYLKSLEAWGRIEHPHRPGPLGLEFGDPAQVTKNLHLCEVALASPNSRQPQPPSH